MKFAPMFQREKVPFTAILNQEEEDSESLDTDLVTEKTSFLLSESVTQRSPNKRRSDTLRILIILNAILLCMNLGSGAAFLTKIISGTLLGDRYSFNYDYAPLSSIVTMKPVYRSLKLGDRSMYTLPPSDEVDAAWDSISSPPGKVGLISVKKHELDQLNLTTIPLKDSTESFAMVKVFHDIHCLDYLRKQIYNATYYQISPDEFPLQEEHIVHCIDSLRHSSQCRPDLSLHTFKYIHGWPKPWADFRQTQTCANFDEIRAWAETRQFNKKKTSSSYEMAGKGGRSRLVPHPEKELLVEKAHKGELNLKLLVESGVRWLDVGPS